MPVCSVTDINILLDIQKVYRRDCFIEPISIVQKAIQDINYTHKQRTTNSHHLMIVMMR